MKRFSIIFIVLLCILALSAPVFAQSEYGIKAKAVTTSTANTLQDVVVFGIAVVATTAAAYAGVYDCATLSEASNSTLRGEASEATQHDRDYQPLPVPTKMTNVTIVVTNGTGIVYYR